MSSTFLRLFAVGTAAAVTLVSFSPSPTASAAPLPLAAKTSAPAKQAAAWLTKNAASADDGYNGQVANALGLAALDTTGTAATLRTRVAALAADAPTQAAASAGTAANLAILVEILRGNPKSFGGVDLIQKLTAGIDATGQVGSFGSAYGQALAVIALKRAGEPVAPNIVSTLLSFQSADPATKGAFGYEYNGFVADPDSTALAIQALNLIGGHKQEIAAALAWAKANQTTAGYWDSYSPVDSTALMLGAYTQLGKTSAKARSWLLTQQLSDGGFPASRDGVDSNLTATSTAAFALARTSLAKAKYTLRHFTASPRPKITGTAKLGRTLTAKPRTWKPAAKLAYQWYAGGTKIAGATAATYLLTSSEVGKKIRVRVTATAIGVKTMREWSKPTARVQA